MNKTSEIFDSRSERRIRRSNQKVKEEEVKKKFSINKRGIIMDWLLLNKKESPLEDYCDQVLDALNKNT
jgi:hypothetical protein